MKPIMLASFICCFASCFFCSFGQTGWKELTVRGSSETSLSISANAFTRDRSGLIYAALNRAVFKWNGVVWEELGTNCSSLNANASIQCVAVDSVGNVYAAGSFTNSTNHAYVAKWDGTSWSELGTPGTTGLDANSVIYTLATDATGNIYAAGAFKNSTNHLYVARWNGIGWTELGFGQSALNATNIIFTVTTDKNGNVYTASGSQNISQVSKWNGTAWTQLGTGINALNANNWIRSIISDSSGNIFVAGLFTNTAHKEYVAKWNGTNWTELGAGANALNANGYILGLALDGMGNIYTAGDFKDIYGLQYVAKWNGTNWTELGYGGSGAITSVVTDLLGRVYAGGAIRNSYGNYFVGMWDGTNWLEVVDHNMALNQNGYISAIATDTFGNVYASGNFADTLLRTYVAKWNGNIWSELGTGQAALYANAAILSIAVNAVGNVFAAGNFTNGSGKRYVAKWDGSNWTELGGGTAGALFANDYINSIVVSGNGNVYAAGQFKNASGKYYVARWDGVSWSELGSGSTALNANREILSLTTDAAGNIYAAGLFTNSSNTLYVAKWNGVSWIQLGGGIGQLEANAGINSITIANNGNLYAAGSDGVNSSGAEVVTWNGTNWSVVGNFTAFNFGPGSSITSLTTNSAGNIFAALGFSNSAGKTFVTKWDGSSWSYQGCGLGISANSSAITTVKYDTKTNTLYAGGYFENSRGLIYVAATQLNPVILPLTFLSFTVKQEKNNALLQWHTSNEVGASYYNIERSFDGANFTLIGRVTASNNNISDKYYTYTDIGLTSTGVQKLFYRLVETDKDGTITISKVVVVNITPGKLWVTISPNPVKDMVTFHSLVNKDNVGIQIADMTGKIVYRSTQNLKAGGVVQINSSAFTRGNYIVIIQDRESRQEIKMMKATL